MCAATNRGAGTCVLHKRRRRDRDLCAATNKDTRQRHTCMRRSWCVRQGHMHVTQLVCVTYIPQLRADHKGHYVLTSAVRPTARPFVLQTRQLQHHMRAVPALLQDTQGMTDGCPNQNSLHTQKPLSTHEPIAANLRKHAPHRQQLTPQTLAQGLLASPTTASRP